MEKKKKDTLDYIQAQRVEDRMRQRTKARVV